MKKHKSFRPFSLSAKVHCNGYSTSLQRVIVDFGSNVSFAETGRRLKDHYELENISASSIRIITERHARIVRQNISKIQKKRSVKAITTIIMESDGGMVPIVTVDEEANDKRKTRSVGWVENKLSLAYGKGTIDCVYASTLGSVEFLKI